MTLTDDLKRALQRYDQAVDDGLDESQIDSLFEEAENIVPNARLSELYFYGERDRSHDEVVSEASIRESLWESAGDIAVLLHVQTQMRATIGNPSASVTHRVVAEQVLFGVERELHEHRGKLN